MCIPTYKTERATVSQLPSAPTRGSPPPQLPAPTRNSTPPIATASTKDPKTRLKELCDKDPNTSQPVYETHKVMDMFQATVKVFDKTYEGEKKTTKKEAEKSAAEKALAN